MSTDTQDENAPEKGVSFYVPADFKRLLDVGIADRQTTLRDFATRALAVALGVPVPGEESERRKRQAQEIGK